MSKIVLATHNKNKVQEFKDILESDIVFLSDVGFNEDIIEDGSTFLENALIKAKTVSERLNIPILSDDSGLVVEALNGEPGIKSARYSSEKANDKDNRNLLLKNLSGKTNRKAKFVTFVVLYFPNGKYFVGQGEAFGTICENEIGENGFGYDSLFFSSELNKTFAEATKEEKNSVSHRKKAIENLKQTLINNGIKL